MGGMLYHCALAAQLQTHTHLFMYCSREIADGPLCAATQFEMRRTGMDKTEIPLREASLARRYPCQQKKPQEA
eukprot:3329619-Amphidinium_carterae.1